MKKVISCLGVIAILLFSVACESSRILPNGERKDCIGIADEKDPTLNYKLSTRNAVIGILFLEMIFPPVIVAANELLCPVSVKPDTTVTN
jgi:hypothetical protein